MEGTLRQTALPWKERGGKVAFERHWFKNRTPMRAKARKNRQWLCRRIPKRSFLPKTRRLLLSRQSGDGQGNQRSSQHRGMTKMVSNLHLDPRKNHQATCPREGSNGDVNHCKGKMQKPGLSTIIIHPKTRAACQRSLHPRAHCKPTPSAHKHRIGSKTKCKT